MLERYPHPARALGAHLATAEGTPDTPAEQGEAGPHAKEADLKHKLECGKLIKSCKKKNSSIIGEFPEDTKKKTTGRPGATGLQSLYIYLLIHKIFDVKRYELQQYYTFSPFVFCSQDPKYKCSAY